VDLRLTDSWPREGCRGTLGRPFGAGPSSRNRETTGGTYGTPGSELLKLPWPGSLASLAHARGFPEAPVATRRDLSMEPPRDSAVKPGYHGTGRDGGGIEGLAAEGGRAAHCTLHLGDGGQCWRKRKAPPFAAARSQGAPSLEANCAFQLCWHPWPQRGEVNDVPKYSGEGRGENPERGEGKRNE